MRKENVRIWRRPILPLVYADIADSAEFFFTVAFVMDDLSSHELSVHYYIRYPASIRPYRMRRLVYNLHDWNMHVRSWVAEVRRSKGVCVRVVIEMPTGRL